MLKNCPTTQDEGSKGAVWVSLNKDVKSKADDFLKSHESYKPPTLPASFPKQNQGPTRVNNKPHGPGQKMSPPERYLKYLQLSTQSEIFYPNPVGLAKKDKSPADTGYPWHLPKETEDRSTVLNIAAPKYPLRRKFCADDDPGAILTNHFEYTVNKNTIFHEYKILDQGTKY